MAGIRLFLSGIDYYATDRDLRDFLKYHCGWGSVLDAGVVPDEGCKNKGVAFCTIRESCVSKALDLNGVRWRGHVLGVSVATNAGPRPPRRDRRYV
jgi:hypothetical protein